MTQMIHGGDIYRNKIFLDFSVNVNPFGTPAQVREALEEAAGLCGKYPDIRAEELRSKVGEMLGIPGEYLLFGNGSSELFMAIVHGLMPKMTVIPVPSFYGYEYAAGAVKSRICYYEMWKEGLSEGKAPSAESFLPDEDFFEVLTEDADLLFIANPNNPTGSLLSWEYLYRLLSHCRDRGIRVVLDECFIEFSGKNRSMIGKIREFKNLILVRAFTKIFAIPGVRLGYLACGDTELLEKIGRQLPEWNLSVFAQSAGCVCARLSEFVNRTADYVRGEREYLRRGLESAGLRVFPGEADFLLVYSEEPLYEKLLERGILIRDCKNFRGLREGFYRIAVRNREDNDVLLREIAQVLRKGKI